ncbi:HTH-type transcriptional regulator SrpS [compost metagenome]|jgi:DNA-binding IclR family transcriptional regulator
MSQDKEASSKQVIARAAAMLSALEKFPFGASLSQLSEACGLPRTTVHRMVGSLEAQQLVITDTNGVRLGPALVRLAASAHKDVIGISRPYIEALGRKTGETVDLCIYRGTHSVLVDQYVSNQELRVVSPIGTAFPIHCTAHGKALLAVLKEQVLETMFSTIDSFDTRTANTLKDVKALRKELVNISRAGYAVDREEHARGVCGIGIHLHTGFVDQYALALAVPMLRFEENFDELKAALLQCKAEIESVIGVS